MKLFNLKFRGHRDSLMAGVIALALTSTAAFAANNVGVGDVAGDDAALVDSTAFSINSTGAALTLVKTAYLANGTELASGATLATGTKVKFMIFLNNQSSVAVNDVTIRDVLDPLFVYDAGTLKVDSSRPKCAATVCDATEKLAIFNAVDATTALTDAVSNADAGSYDSGTKTIHAGNNVAANAQLNAPADSVLAVSFTVTIQ